VQSACPSCGNRIVVDDSRVPDRAFSVKCPKCQTMVKFPGKAPAAAPPPTTSAEPAGAAADAAPTAAGAPESMGEQTMAHLRRELADAGRVKGQVLVALPDRSLAGTLTMPLSRIGYSAETMENADDAARALEQGLYDVVITSREGGGQSSRGETLLQRVQRLSADVRRSVFLVLVGDDFRTGDGTQAFTAMADLVVHPRDAAAVEPVLLKSIAERNRLYQAFLDAKKRHDNSAH
jgi:predicted Zn finger-like uncharacterized protein